MKDNIKKIIEYGIYLLVFILPLQTRWIFSPGEFNGGYSEYFTYSLYGFDILLFILIGLEGTSIIINKKDKTIKAPVLWILLGIFEFICFISIFFALDRTLAVFVYVRLLFVFGFFFVIIKSKYDKNKIFLSFIASAFFQSLFVVWQFVTQSGFANKWLGLAKHDPAELGVSVVEAVGASGHSERWLRAYGSLDHPNMLGGFLALALILIMFYRIKQNKKVHLFFIFAYVVIGFALVFSFSRSAWLGLLLGLLIIALISIKRRALQAQKIIAQSILMISVIFFALFLIYPNLFMTRVSADSRLENISKEERISAIDTAQKISQEYSAIGTGIGNYTKAQAEIKKLQYSYKLQPVHNVFLLIRSETGIFGILVFLVILLYYLQIIIKSKENIYLIGGFILILIIFMFDHWLWSLHFGLMLLAFISGGVIKLIYSKEF
ncbi:MAG: O-antigen ligase family protein [Patescibacteria group bacterium]|nr:O-antigen ligase family protein [Patescibacteria group bacterium]